MDAELLFEIGTEEIPSGYLEEGLEAFKRLVDNSLQEDRIARTGILETYGTPRRLILVGEGISKTQEDLIEEIWGPPKSVAFDEKGVPTKAAQGFAAKQGVKIDDLKCADTPKGEYVYVKRKVPGRPTQEVLAGALSGIVAEIPWPKSMRWGDTGFPFVRPIHWLVALFDGEIIPLEIAGVRSGRVTRGHRFMGSSALEVTDFRDYRKKMKDHFVVIDPGERKEMVLSGIREAAKREGGVPSSDPELVSTVSNLVEFPSPVCGGFDPAFLELPDTVLTTAMKEHQRYFAVYDDQGRLIPRFVAVNNTLAKDEGVVQKGHERVLRARLADADFFFKEDRKRPLADRLEDLKKVTYQADLGTSFDKVRRFSKLARYLAERVLPDGLENVETAASLSKCDLVTLMVTEFPSLQGVMGMEYARIEGYPEAVCLPIYEHYLPTKAGGVLPSGSVGAVVGMADRMDTIAGCFAVGLTPSGSADPFALRRHALAILRILEEKRWDVSLPEFIEKSLEILGGTIEIQEQRLLEDLLEFFRERYRQMVRRSGYEPEVVEAVVSACFDRIHRLRERIDQLSRFVSGSREFEKLSLTAKRVANILRNQASSVEVDPSLFQDPSEAALWERCQAAEKQVLEYLRRACYEEALSLMAGLAGPVDDFFEGVEILTRDAKLRENRLGLLKHLQRLFLTFADFSKLSV